MCSRYNEHYKQCSPHGAQRSESTRTETQRGRGVMIQELIGKEVEVNTVEVIYRGILIEVGESEIQLQSESGCIIVPLEKVVDMKAVD